MKIDISQQYYTFELSDKSKKYCVTMTPFGIYQYNVLPMGVHCAPDFAQEQMDEMFHDMDETSTYIDDIVICIMTWEQNIRSINKVLNRLGFNGFTVKPLKCEWVVQETDWLGYRLTPTGLKPWRKKIDAMLRIKPPPTTTKI